MKAIKEKNCSVCEYCSDGEVAPDLRKIFYCLKNPPFVIVVHTQNGPQIMTMFPANGGEQMVCGQFSPVVAGFQPRIVA